MALRKISISGVRGNSVQDDALQPSVELFPFCGDGKDVNSGELADATFPGEWPFDRQCVMRFPLDVAQKLEASIHEASQSDNKKKVLNLKLRQSTTDAPGEAPNRRFRVQVFGEQMNGTLVDLACHAETHVRENASQVELYKSADISQMLIVHRGSEPTGHSVMLDKRTFRWASGLTPPTRHIRERKFAEVRESELDPKLIREASRAIRARMGNEPYEYEELAEVDEATKNEIMTKQPDSIWRPPQGMRSSFKTAMLQKKGKLGIPHSAGAAHPQHVRPVQRLRLRVAAPGVQAAVPGTHKIRLTLGKRRLKMGSSADTDVHSALAPIHEQPS